MDREFKTYDSTLSINDEGIKYESNSGKNLYFPYGSIVSIRLKGISFLTELEIIGRNKNLYFSGMLKDDRGEIKKLIPFIQEKMKHAEPENVLENVSDVKDSKALLGLARASYEVSEFLMNHRKNREIVEDNVFGFNKLSVLNIDKLFNEYNARFVFTYHNDPSWKRESCVIITTNMVYLRNGEDGKEIFYIGKDMSLFVSRMQTKKIMQSNVRTKKSSVVGSAVAGGVIAGGVGAVVGAIAAADKNANGGRTVVGKAYDSGDRELIVNGVSGNLSGHPYPYVSKVYVASKISNNCPVICRYKDSQRYREFGFTISSQITGSLYDEFCAYLEKLLRELGGNPNK